MSALCWARERLCRLGAHIPITRLPGAETYKGQRSYAVCGAWRVDWIPCTRWQRVLIVTRQWTMPAQTRLVLGLGAGVYDLEHPFSWMPAVFRLHNSKETRAYTWAWFHVTWSAG